MRHTTISSHTDLAWLLDTHLASFKLNVLDFACAEIQGNEDAPTRIELFKQDHYRCVPFVYVWVEDANDYQLRLLKGAGKLRRRTLQERRAGCL